MKSYCIVWLLQVLGAQTWDRSFLQGDGNPVFARSGQGKIVYRGEEFGFNGPMDIRYSQSLIQKIFDSLSAHIAIIDDQGRILETNAAWKTFSLASGGQEEFRGMNYLAVCEAAEGEGDALAVARGIKEVISGERQAFFYDYPCHLPEGERWFYMRAVRMEDHGRVRVIVSHEDITGLKLAQEALRHHQKALEEKNLSLEEANTALRVLVRQREADMAEQEKKVLSHIGTFVTPYLNRLKSGGRLGKQDLTLLDIAQSQLKQVASPTRMAALDAALTPQEMQVASLVREGKTTAEIADVLYVSQATVSFHRRNLRRKLGLTGQKENLRACLLSM